MTVLDAASALVLNPSALQRLAVKSSSALLEKINSNVVCNIIPSLQLINDKVSMVT